MVSGWDEKSFGNWHKIFENGHKFYLAPILPFIATARNRRIRPYEDFEVGKAWAVKFARSAGILTPFSAWRNLRGLRSYYKLR